MEPNTEPSTWASGSQIENGYAGVLTSRTKSSTAYTKK